MATLFHLIRHASYGQLGRSLAGRTPGYALSAAGRAEAAALGRALAGRRLDAVLSSPVQRAMETAAAVAAPHGRAIQPEPGLAEVNFGVWTGAEFAALDPRADWQDFNALRSFAPVPGGETMLSAQARAVEALLRARAAWPDGELALVSHGDVIKALVAHAAGIPLDLFRRIEIAPASRSILKLDARSVELLGVNWPPEAGPGPA